MAAARSLPVARDWRAWGQSLLGLVVHLLGMALVVFVALGLAEDASLWVFGRTVEAQVTATWIEQDTSRSEIEPSYRWFVRYAFTTPDGRTVNGVSTVSAKEAARLSTGRPMEFISREREASALREGDVRANGPTVGVVYFPPVPRHNRLDDSMYAALLACAYVPLTLAGCAGLALGRRLLRAE